MPRQNTIQTSWTKGEVSPLAAGRVDVNLYANGAETIENLFVLPQGPVFRRSGTKFVRSTKFPTQAARIIPFTVSNETAYELEFGAGYIHFYKNKEPLFETTTTEVEAFTVSNNGGLMQLTSNSIPELPNWVASAISNSGGLVRMTFTTPHTMRTGQIAYVSTNGGGFALNGQFTLTRISAYIVDVQASVYDASITTGTLYSHGLMAGDRFFISGAADFPTLTEQFHTVKSVEDYDTWTIANVPFSGSGSPAMEEAHTIPIEVVTSFTEADLPDIRFVQSADVLYLFHPDYPTQKLTRLDTDGDRLDWLLSTINFTDGPYLPFNDLTPNLDTVTPANGAKYLDVYFEVSSYVHTATVKSATDFDPATDDTGSVYVEYRKGDQWRLAKIQSGSITVGSPRTGTVDIIDNIMAPLDETTRLKRRNAHPSIPGSQTNSQTYYRNYGQRDQVIDPRNAVASTEVTTAAPTAAAALAAGSVKSQFSNTFSQSDVGRFIRLPSNPAPPIVGTGPVNYWAQILKVDAAGDAGSVARHSASVALASNYTTGEFSISNEVRTATITAYRAGATFAAFTSTDVGRLMRLGFGGRWTWGKITGYTSTSVVTLTLYEDMPRDPSNAANIAGAKIGVLTYTAGFVNGLTTGRTYDWRMGAWSDTTGYPTCGAFHEQRLWMASTTVQPQTFWGSVSGDFENMAPTEFDSTVLDDNAIAYTLGSSRANAIQWMVSGPAMHIGTSGGEWQVKASTSAQEAITPSNIKATEYTGHGAKGSCIPARIGSSVVFVDRSGEKAQEIFYNYQNDAVDSDDVTVISEHILRNHGGAVASAFQQKPHSVFWVLCGDGTLAGMTYNKKQEVIAWHHHTIKGGTVEDISVIPSSDLSEDELWMVVKRTISGGTKRYIEVLESDYYPSSSSSRLGMKFLDSHMLIEDWTGTVITGLNHLEGQTVVAVANGVRLAGTFTVASGSITITGGAVNELLIGLLGNADLGSLPPEGGSQFGTSQGQMKRVVFLDCRFYNQNAISYGPSSASLQTRTLPVTSPTVWFTGTERLVPASGYDVESSWYLRQAEPYPFNLLFVVSKLETNE